MDKKENKDEVKKYFNPEEYVTKIVGPTDDSDKDDIFEDKVSAIVSLLTDPENKELKEETLLTLKKEKAGDLIITAISNLKAKPKKHILVAACWESEINFSDKLPFFINLALDTDYLVSLEAITVIENMEGPFNISDVSEAIKKVKAFQKSITNEKAVLLNDLVIKLESFLKD